MKILRFKRLNMNWPPLEEGKPICPKNPYLPHGTAWEHTCTMELEEIEVDPEKPIEKEES